MAGFASFGMPMGNDNSAAAQKARKEGLARIALAKKSGYKSGGFIGGKSGPIMESTSIGDFVNRLARNYTVDVGDATSRTIQDTFLGGKGKSNVLDYSLVKPDTGFGILDAAIKYNPTYLLAGNLLNNADFSQMLAPGDVVPVQKIASLGLKGVKASPNILKGIKMAAGRTSADALSAASGGLLRGSPVRAARGAPDEFDEIINAAKAEDPTLGDVAPEGTAPAPFRSEDDWDFDMSVNYAKARQRIMDDLEPSFQKLMDDGEDPAIIDPLVDDSIAALHSEIGNLSTARYNHNDLEDFLGRVAAPDDYIVADTWLAKRADNFVHDLGVEYEAWGKDPDKWLQEAGYGVDPEAFRGLLDDIGMDAAAREATNAKPVRNTEPYSVVLSPEEVNMARSGSPIGIPMEASSESRGLATPEEYAQLSPDERAIEDSVRSISRQVWGNRRGLNEPPAKYQVQDYPTVENVTEVITKGSKRYGKLSTKQIEALHKSIGEYIDATPGAKWRIGNRQGLDIHHMDPYASGGVGDPAKLAPLQSTMNRFIGKKPMSIWYREQVNNGVINVWKDIAPELIASIEAAL